LGFSHPQAWTCGQFKIVSEEIKFDPQPGLYILTELKQFGAREPLNPRGSSHVSQSGEIWGTQLRGPRQIWSLDRGMACVTGGL
jgi:hypothetical protein